MNKEFKRMQKLAGLDEIRINKPKGLSTPEAFQRFINRIPNEKYFYIFNEDDFNEDDYDIGDLENLLHLEIFDNELKDKPGIEGDDFYEFEDTDQDQYHGRKTTILSDKVRNIITSYNPNYQFYF
jgi:hypothetical protein